MTATINDRLVRTAFDLANRGAIAMAEQDQFAKRDLDNEQAQKFLAICYRARNGLSGQQLLDAVVAAIQG